MKAAVLRLGMDKKKMNTKFPAHENWTTFTARAFLKFLAKIVIKWI